MSNSVIVLDEQVLEVISGGRLPVWSTVYAPNNSKTNNSTISLSCFGMNAIGNAATSGGAIGNIAISVLQGNA